MPLIRIALENGYDMDRYRTFCQTISFLTVFNHPTRYKGYISGIALCLKKKNLVMCLFYAFRELNLRMLHIHIIVSKANRLSCS